MFKRTKFIVSAIALTWIIASPRSGAVLALQEIRIGSSVIGFSSLMSYFARDLKLLKEKASTPRSFMHRPMWSWRPPMIKA